MKARPTIAEVNCTRLQFDPGDRILVRTTRRLDKDQIKKMRQQLTKWAGCEVEILIVCILDMDISIEQKKK